MTLAPEEVRIVLGALDLYMRLGMGQLQEIRSHFSFHTEFQFDVEEVDRLCDRLKEAIFPRLHKNGFHSISNCPDMRARIAYDIFQTLRHADAWARMPEGPKAHGPTVVFDDPLYVTDHRPEVKSIGLLDRLAEASEPSQPTRPKQKRRK